MKNLILLIGFCFFSFYGYGQVDSIEETSLKKMTLEVLTEKMTASYYKTDFENSLIYAIQILEVIKRDSGEYHINYPESLVNVGTMLMYLGKLEKARIYFLEAMAKLEKIQEVEQEIYGLIINNLAVLYEKMGQYEQSLPYMLEAMQVTEHAVGKSHFNFAVTKINLARLYVHLGQHETALHSYLDALGIIEAQKGEEHPWYPVCLNHIGSVYLDTQQYEQAEKYFKKALDIIEKNNGKESTNYAVALNNLAMVKDKQGQFHEAIRSYQESKNIIEKILGNDHTHFAAVLNNLGIMNRNLHNFDQAIFYFKKSIEVKSRTLGDAHPEWITTFMNLAGIYHWQEKIDSAKFFYNKVLKNYAEQLNNYFPVLSENDRIEFSQTLKKNIATILSFAFKQSNLSKEIQSFNLQQKGLALKNSLETTTTILNSLDSNLLEQYYDWKTLQRKIAKAYTLSNQQQINQKLKLDSLQQIANRLEGQLSRASATISFQLEYQKRRTTFQDLKKELAPNEAAIDFLNFQYYNGKEWTDSTLYCALLTRNNSIQPEMFVLTETKELQKILQNAVTDISDNFVTNPQKGQLLYELLWEPLLPYLIGIQKIHLSPSGLLHKIAFDALPTNKENSKRLCDEYEIVYHSTLRDFVLKKNYGQHGKNITLVGGALFDLDSISMTALAQNIEMESSQKFSSALKFISRTRAFPQNPTRYAEYFGELPDSKKEVENIAQQFHQHDWEVEVYTEQQALEDKIKAQSGVEAPVILHLATHGYFFALHNKKQDNTLRERIITSKNPFLRSGLVFTGVNHTWQGGQPVPGMEDGVLTAYEISNLDLLNTNLVVLSACETGLGDVHDAEGVFGLQRAFKTAGVENLIVSLWKVPDEQTSELMQLFYKHYLGGDSIRTAFRKAQKVMREKSPPYFWAGFILIE